MINYVQFTIAAICSFPPTVFNPPQRPLACQSVGHLIVQKMSPAIWNQKMVSKVARLDILDYYRYTRLTYADIIYGYLWLEQYLRLGYI